MRLPFEGMIDPTEAENSKSEPERAASATQATAGPGIKGEEKPLSAEEQMALYEQDLKENDWGHQPC